MGEGARVKFVLVDRIAELESGKRLVAIKSLSLAEEYLADHFPTFPVLPGVLMLEAMTQASAWLVREALEFGPALVVLKEARNVTYKSFLAPGQSMRVETNCRELSREQSVFNAQAVADDGRLVVKAALTLRHLNLADTNPALSETDERIRSRMRLLFGLLWSGRPARRIERSSPVAV